METKKIKVQQNPNEKTCPTDREILAQNIVFFRKKLGISQTELANRLQYSNKNISKWECGETSPDIFTIKKLATIFNVSIDTLLSPITDDTKTAIKTKQSVPLRWKVYMLLLANAIFFLSICITFFILKSTNVVGFPIQYIFIFMLPIMDLSVFIFLCCIRKKVDPITLSIFGWLIVICFYISFISSKNINYIFIIAVGYQVLVPVFAALINSGKIIKINKLFIKITKRQQKKEQNEA